MPLHKGVFYRGLKQELFAARQSGAENDVDDRELFKRKLADWEAIWRCPRNVSHASVGSLQENTRAVKLLIKRGRFNHHAAVNIGADTYADPELALASLETGRLVGVEGPGETKPLTVFTAHENMYAAGGSTTTSLPYNAMFRVGFTLKRHPSVFKVDGASGVGYGAMYDGTEWGPAGSVRPRALLERERALVHRKRSLQQLQDAATRPGPAVKPEPQQTGAGGGKKAKNNKGEKAVAAPAPRPRMEDELHSLVGSEGGGLARGGEVGSYYARTHQGNGADDIASPPSSSSGRAWWVGDAHDTTRPLRLKVVSEADLASEARTHHRLRGLRPLAPLRERLDVRTLGCTGALVHEEAEAGMGATGGMDRDVALVPARTRNRPSLRYDTYKPASNLTGKHPPPPDFRVCFWDNHRFPHVDEILLSHVQNQQGQLRDVPSTVASLKREVPSTLSPEDLKVAQPVPLRHAQVLGGVSWLVMDPVSLPFTK